jgi:cysteine desulfurase
MGFSAEHAACALRVSLGPQNKQEDIERFVEVWGAHQHRLQGRHRSA